jgi:Ca2+-binding RTX toxin-like protein
LLEGGDGNDSISGNKGSDILKGGTGNDWMAGANGQDQLYGETGADMLLGGAGKDRLYGGYGNDSLDGGTGADTLAGGEGRDTASYSSSAIAVIAKLDGGGAGNGGGAAGDTFSSIESLTGSAWNDSLYGNKAGNVLEGGAGQDKLSGGGGADILRGGDGADWLDGGAWKDVLSGGTGADSFYFGAISQAGDTITDFQPGYDQLVLSRTGFGLDPYEKVAFVEGSEATKAAPTLLYDGDDGRLLWDADGTGWAKAVLLASFSSHPNISAGDILIG